MVRALERLGVPFEISGIHHLEELETPCVVVGNHMSVLETFVLQGLIRPIRPVTFIVKESLTTYPVFGHVMRSRDPVVVTRSRDPVVVTRTNPRQDLKAVLEGGKERLDRGVSIVVFPQTTPTPSFSPDEFNTIGVKSAQKAGVPILPLAVLTDAWGTGKRFEDFGRIDPSRTVHLSLGEPLQVEGRGTWEHRAVISFIQENLARWREGRGQVASAPADAGGEGLRRGDRRARRPGGAWVRSPPRTPRSLRSLIRRWILRWLPPLPFCQGQAFQGPFRQRSCEQGMGEGRRRRRVGLPGKG